MQLLRDAAGAGVKEWLTAPSAADPANGMSEKYSEINVFSAVVDSGGPIRLLF